MIQVTGYFNPPNRADLYKDPILKVILHGEAGKILCDVEIYVDDMRVTAFPMHINRNALTYDNNVTDTYDRFVKAILGQICTELNSQDYSLNIQ